MNEAGCAVRGVPGAASMVFYYEAIATMSLSDAVRVAAVWQAQRMYWVVSCILLSLCLTPSRCCSPSSGVLLRHGQ